ncbi:serine hydrolase domain-containing protein [Streptomyces sp. NPDC020096]|jgi:CubicO group peptidase (beta-lactamase class C family)
MDDETAGADTGAEECPPGDVDMDRAALDRALGLVADHPGQAQLCVLRHGRVVLNRSYGCPPDALFLLWSAGKPLIALLTWLLAERGLISLDDPVGQYWPQYARCGKAAVTVRHVLQHRSGAPLGGRSVLGDALAMTDWERSVRRIARACPRWPAGQVPAYHIISYGFVLGELVRRVTGVPVDRYLRTELLDPLGLRDIHAGLPDALWARGVPVRAPASGDLSARVRERYFNRRAVRTAVIPAANTAANARDLAALYEMLLRGGELGGTRVLAAATVAEARRSSTSEGEVDQLLQLPVRWSQGFQLGGGTDRRTARPMGMLSGRETFGHNGSNYCNAWADPERDLVFVYLTNVLVPPAEGVRRQSAVSDAVLAACR